MTRRKFPIKFYLRFAPGGSGFLNCLVSSYPDSFSAHPEIGSPIGFVLGYPWDATGVIGVNSPAIPSILGGIYKAEISLPIIQDIPINVVYPALVLTADSKDKSGHRKGLGIPSWRASNPIPIKAPQMVSNNGQVFSVNLGIFSMQTDLNIGNHSVNYCFGRCVSFPALTERWHG